MDKVPRVMRQQRVAQRGRYTAQTACRSGKSGVRFRTRSRHASISLEAGLLSWFKKHNEYETV
jgi:hypothetical protein